jgi:hypothetical protein
MGAALKAAAQQESHQSGNRRHLADPEEKRPLHQPGFHLGEIDADWSDDLSQPAFEPFNREIHHLFAPDVLLCIQRLSARATEASSPRRVRNANGIEVILQSPKNVPGLTSPTTMASSVALCQILLFSASP